MLSLRLKWLHQARFAGWYLAEDEGLYHLILRALLRRAGVDPATVNEIAQAESMQPFLQGDVSVAAATFFNQLPQLRSQGLTDLVAFDPADQGVLFPRDVIITSEKMITDHPDVVRRLLGASLRGWKRAIADQTAAVAAVTRRDPTLDRQHQAVMIGEVSKLMTHGAGTARGIGWIEPTAVQAAHDFLVENGQLVGAIDVGRSHTTRFWQAV